MELITTDGLTATVRLTKQEFDFLEELSNDPYEPVTTRVLNFAQERVAHAIDEHEFGVDMCTCSWCASTSE